MSASSHPKKEYLVVFAALFVLTVIEVWAATALSGTAKWMSLVVLASVKAGCVGWWYMHLKQEKPWLVFIAMFPLIAAFYAIVLIQEVGAR
jgi:cytochrome c oxidase subunit IV